MKLAIFQMVIGFTTPRHLTQLHASSFTGPIFFSFHSWFFYVRFDRLLLNSKAFCVVILSFHCVIAAKNKYVVELQPFFEGYCD